MLSLTTCQVIIHLRQTLTHLHPMCTLLPLKAMNLMVIHPAHGVYPPPQRSYRLHSLFVRTYGFKEAQNLSKTDISYYA
jgi:hypothetical protein